ncbi:fumarylacetoacetase [Knoellia subterranea]|uniref:fumarylacetoacetase n=1 Tax=Knoellia subterranea KCTC 19937 TaxID=1385521 RepID=A0A0A0JR70_9MICO|nr:fumarylacetoacetase [Knoellia subterranea]KGN39234.1 fumarylacetoacetase [Knoellia subterranea KCTC 19937]
MTWLDLPADHPFGISNLPYGVFSTDGSEPRVGTRIGDHVLDLAACAEQAGMESHEVWHRASLNAFLAQGRPAWTAARAWIIDVLTNPARRDCVEPHLIPVADVKMHLPIAVADYVDFYASEHHATNVGRLFRPDTEPLTPNWKHLPIGYHGRSGTVVVSGTDIVRPSGQRKAPTDAAPTFGPSVRLDIEAELGFIVGGATELGSPVSLADSDDHIFGAVLLNDWSSRDLQAWEYVPLGPFLGKSFATTISPWVVTSEALRAARVPLPGQTDPTPLPYLQGEATADGASTAYGLDITYEVEWNGTVVAHPPYAAMYWSPAQMLTHMTVNGATLRDGDLYGSGTISGPEKGQRGSFLELSWGGKEPVTLNDGSTRSFLEDGDTVVLRATAPGADGTTISFGECVGTIRPAR